VLTAAATDRGRLAPTRRMHACVESIVTTPLVALALRTNTEGHSRHADVKQLRHLSSREAVDPRLVGAVWERRRTRIGGLAGMIREGAT
jgi:hypothetical protein